MIFYLGSHATLLHKDPVVDDPKQRRPDISLAKSWLNWSPKVNFRRFFFFCFSILFFFSYLKISLVEGLNRTIAYFRNELLVRHHSERNVFFPTEWLHSSSTDDKVEL